MTLLKPGPSAGYTQPGFSSVGDLTANVPLHALVDFVNSRRALQTQKSVISGVTPNDALFQWRNMRDAASLRPGNIAETELTFLDGTTLEGDLTGDVAQGTYSTAVKAAGSLTGPGVLRPSANPNLITFATAAAHLDDVCALGLFVTNTASATPVQGVAVRCTAATDHIRAEVRNNGTQAHLVTRDSSSDTSDLDVDVADAMPANSLAYVSIGIRYNADDSAIVVVNGNVVIEDAVTNTDAQAHTGNGVGIWMSGAASLQSGLIAFNAFSVA